jgi:hypothetical protein
LRIRRGSAPIHPFLLFSNIEVRYIYRRKRERKRKRKTDHILHVKLQSREVLAVNLVGCHQGPATSKKKKEIQKDNRDMICMLRKSKRKHIIWTHGEGSGEGNGEVMGGKTFREKVKNKENQKAKDHDHYADFDCSPKQRLTGQKSSGQCW